MARRQAARRLTDRDYAILRWIGQAGIAAEEQLQRRFWTGRSRETAQGRLTQLVKAGYLEQTTCDARGQEEVVYALTRQGHRQFAVAERALLQVGLPPLKARQQQLLAQEAYIRLDAEARAAGGRVHEWRSERVLRSEFRRAQQAAIRWGQPPPTWEIADGQVVIVTADGLIQEIDIEIDGQYYGRMLRSKAARFGAGGRPTLWVCTANRVHAVSAAIEPYSNIRILAV
jgi:DNA-binding PadR family transcriptional regulator